MDNNKEYILYGAAVALPAVDINETWPDPINNKALHIRDGRIYAIIDDAELPDNIEKIDLGGGIIAPGFIDTQVNGGGNILFNDHPDITGIREIFAAHKRYGTTSILPTLISDDFDKMRAAIAAVNDAIENGEEGILGIHLEGPFLNKVKKGIHDENKFRIIDDEAIEILTSLRNGVTLVTIAPENTNPESIKKLVDNGVIVAAGHTNANYQQIDDAIDVGLKGFTHLYNAMTQLNSREPGVVGAALQDNETISGIILDGVHVSPASAKIAFKSLGAQRMMLVTDAMPVVGGDDEFTLYGRTIRARGGSCFDDNGVLAGSALDMASAVRNAHEMLGVSIGAALQMASYTPAKFLGLSHEVGSIRVGLRADLVHLTDFSQGLLPRNVWL